MKQFLIAILTLCTCLCTAQVHLYDTVYFNNSWQQCSYKDHQYYRLSTLDTITMAPARVIRIRDHYNSGVLEMEGYISADDSSKKMGLYTYYERNGKPERLYLYDFKNSVKYFINKCSYLKKVEACDYNVDLGITLYADGRIKHSGFYLTDNSLGASDARKMCTWKYYNPYTENIDDLCDYKYGKIDGRHFRYHGNGKIWKEEYYKDGKKTGVWKKYRYNGSLRKKKVIKREV